MAPLWHTKCDRDCTLGPATVITKGLCLGLLAVILPTSPLDAADSAAHFSYQIKIRSLSAACSSSGLYRC